MSDHMPHCTPPCMSAPLCRCDPFPDEVESRVIEYAPGKYAPVVARGGKWEFRGGRVYASRESAEAASADEVAFQKRFWASQLEDRSNAVVIGGGHHRLGSQRPERGNLRGVGGRTFRMRSLATGGTVECSDLWWQGIIPDFARAALPDTHEWVDADTKGGA